MASVEDLYGFFHVLSAAENDLRYASNPLILEMALVRMAYIGRVQPLQAILDTLQRLGASPRCRAGAPRPALPAHWSVLSTLGLAGELSER